MPIKEINIKNFKTFVNSQNLKFAPITLLYGANSSGKTSLIKTLDLLSAIFRNYSDNFFTNAGSEGTLFSDIKKNLSPRRIHYLSSYINKKPIEIELKISMPMNHGLLKYKNLKKKET